MERTMNKMALGLSLMALALVVSTGKARAVLTPSANLDLHVNFNGQLSVKVDDVFASTRAISGGPNTAVVPSSASVTNDASGLTEQWQLSLAASTGNWTVTTATSSAPGLDKFDYQALFVSSVSVTANCPIATDNRWRDNVSTVTTSAVNYRTGMYSDATNIDGATGLPDVANGDMYVNSGGPFNGSGRRGLCVRVRIPSSVSTQSSQLIRLTITAATAL